MMKAGPAQFRANESNLELFKYLIAIILPGKLECPDLFGIKLVCKEVLRLFHNVVSRIGLEMLCVCVAMIQNCTLLLFWKLILTVKAILFDMDGVLVDSTAAVARVWHAWATEHGLDPERVIAHAHGRRSIETVRTLAPHLDAERENT